MGQRLIFGMLAIGVVSQSTRAWPAPTPPIAGATALPADFEIRLPFTGGDRVRIICGYGTGCSRFHTPTNSPGYANDYYALDFDLPDYPNAGRDQPVLAAAAGTVASAGWATGGFASYGQMVVLTHDYAGDGHTYRSIYCHLNSIGVSVGQHLAMGDQIGTMGGTSNNAFDVFQIHVHWAMHRDSTVANGASHSGNAVVPEPFDGYEQLAGGQILESHNSGGTPPEPCGTIGAEEAILDDLGPCFGKFGPASTWHAASAGYLDHSLWTYTVDEASHSNWVRWDLNFEQAGTYDLWAYIPSGFGQSQQAKYDVTHAGQTDSVVVSQASVSDDWLALGRFEFASGGDQSVVSGDNTGEPYVDATHNTKIVFDALRVRPGTDDLQDGGDTESDPTPEPPRHSGGCGCTSYPTGERLSVAAWLTLGAFALGRTRSRQRRAGAPGRYGG